MNYHPNEHLGARRSFPEEVAAGAIALLGAAWLAAATLCNLGAA
jgi:hypothetical protein